MKYPIAIEPPASDSEAWGVVVPDLEGCFSASDTGVDEAIENAAYYHSEDQTLSTA